MAGPGMPGFSDSAAEFAIGSVMGLRTWSYTPPKMLRGSYGHLWGSADLEAACDAGHADPPVLDCGCGIWAYWNDDWYCSPGDVPGIIEGWGRVLIGERGFRCQKAAIRALAIGNDPNFPEPEPMPPRYPCPRPPSPAPRRWVQATRPSAVTAAMYRVSGVRSLPVHDPDAEMRTARAYEAAMRDYDRDRRRWERKTLPDLTTRYNAEHAAWEERKRKFAAEFGGLAAKSLRERYDVPVFTDVATMLLEYPVQNLNSEVSVQ